MGTERGSVRWHRGGWEVRIQIDGHRTTRRVRAPNTRAGRQQAEAALDALVASPDRLTVADVIELHRLAASPDWSPSTRATQPHHAAPVLVALGDVSLARLARVDIQRLYDRWRADGIAPGTIRRRHGVLAAALHHAEAEGIIVRSAAAHVRLPPADRALALRDLPAHSTVETAIGRIEHPRLRIAATVALATGIRRGELLALRWTDVDDSQLRIRAAVVVDGPRLIRKATKGRRARTVTIDGATVQALLAWRRVSRAAALVLGVAHQRTMPVVASPSDPRDPWWPDRVTRTWDRHRDQIGLSGFRWHDLRHRHATTLLEAGVPVHTVSARLGHGSAHMTLDVYAHALPAGDRAAADVIARARAT